MIDQSSISILDLTSRYTQIHWTSSYRGGQHSGPCPLPGCSSKDDAFNVYPAEQRWWCRKCGRGGDAMAFIAAYEGINLKSRSGLKAACEALGLPFDNKRSYLPPRKPQQRKQPAKREVKDTAPPDDHWQANARQLVERAQSILWSKNGEKAMKYLTEERGLEKAYIEAAQLGYIPGGPTDWRTDLLPGWKYDRMNKKREIERWDVAVPCGITIPHFGCGEIWGIRVRRSKVVYDDLTYKKLNAKYQAVPGGKKMLYWTEHIAPGKPILLVEGEFDALITYQCAPELVSPLALVSASYKYIEPQWFRYLLSAPVIFVRMDEDAAGRAAVDHLKTLSNRVVDVQVPGGKDVNALYNEGGMVAVWNWLKILINNQEAA